MCKCPLVIVVPKCSELFWLFYLPMQHIRPVDYQYFINKMVEKSVLHFFSSLNEYKISAFFWIMKASEKLCAKSFLRG